MRTWRVIVVLAVAVLWMGARYHCHLAGLPQLQFLSCCHHSGSEKTSADHENDCGNDNCATIESGVYTLTGQNGPVKVAPPLAPASILPATHEQQPVPVLALALSPVPPESRNTWQFSQRAALPARAPSPGS